MNHPTRSLRSVLLVLATVGLGACQHVAARPLVPERNAAALGARTLEAPDLRQFLATVRGEDFAEWPLREWDLATLTLAALHFNPSLAVARAHAGVARAAVETAAARPNPTVAIAPELSANPMGAVSPWLTAVSLEVPIETGGKRGHRMAHATAVADAADEAVLSAAWRVRRDLASALVVLAGASARRESLSRQVAAQERLVSLLEARVAAGAAGAAEVAPIRFALLQATSDRAEAAGQVDEALARVASVLGVPVRALGGVALPRGFAEQDVITLSQVSPEDARRRAVLGRFDVRQALAEYAASEAALRLELARQYPDLRLGPSYQFDQGQNKWGLALSLELPLLNRNEGPIAEATALRSETAAHFTEVQANALGEVEQALARRAGSGARRDVLRGAVENRSATVRRTRQRLTLGAVDRVEVLTAEVDLLQAERAAVDAEMALQQALVDLEGALEGPLPGADVAPGTATGVLETAAMAADDESPEARP